MPAQTISQQKLFGMALAQKRGKAKGASKKVKELAKSMSTKKLKDFAATKHKNIKEGFVLKFNDFVNEQHDELGKAQVTPEGELKGLEFTQEEQLEITSQQDIQNIKNFFEDSGAKSVKYFIKDETVGFTFEYRHDELLALFDLDSDRGKLIDLGTKTTIFSGHGGALLDLIATKGFDFIYYGQ
jgi:hypothetical protein